MSDSIVGLIERGEATHMRRAEVIEITEAGAIVVDGDGDHGPHRVCELLVTTDAKPPVLVPGDRVLAWVPADGAPGIVLGRVGASRGFSSETSEVPDTLTIEAKQLLTIRVGEGSVTIREDGKILIKGKDLVSHAQRLNRIKGGAVAIN